MSLDDRLRRGLPGLASGVDPDPDEALGRVTAAGRRRRAIRRVAAGVIVAVVLAAGGLVVPRLIQAAGTERPSRFAGEPATEPTGQPSVDPERTPPVPGDRSRIVMPGRCAGEVGFRPGYLPAGFDPEPVPGRAPGAPPGEDGQGVVHWTDGQRSIELRRPGMLFVELAQGEDAPTITVLGEDTSSFGPVAPNYENPEDEDHMVQFRYPPDAPPINDHTKDCAFFSLNEYGLGLEELIQVAEGLRPGR
ncbi:MAG TPA: hypothetical protein VHL78_04020 [Actinomycetota bacterium]|nr:hypothetical protein [Actinomycetota bacterium]